MHTVKRYAKLIMVAILVALVPDARAVTCTSAATVNNWNTIGTWSCGHVPLPADVAVIATGSTTTLNVAAGTITSLTVNGALLVSSSLTISTTVAVTAGTLQLNAGTTMNVGTAVTHFITLSNSAATLFQMNGGTLTVAGGITSATTTSAGTFTQTGGTINMATVGLNNQDTFVLGSATTFNMSGGLISLPIGDNSINDVNIISGTQNVTGGTLQMGGIAGNPFLITNTGGGAVNIWNLVVVTAGSPSVQLGAATTSVLNDLTINTGGTLVENGAFALNVGGGNLSGNWTNNGSFTQATSTVTFTGTSATATIGGTSATTFNNMVVNKASNDLTINTTPTVNATLTFTMGRIITGANAISIGTAGTIATPSATSYVVGNFRKNYAAAASLSFFAGNNFPVGDLTSFTPANVSAGTTTTAGSLTVATFTPDHPQVATPIASTGIDAAQSVNRYWKFTNVGLTVGTALTSTFTFVAGDIDAGANTANFIVQRYDGTNWNPTSPVAANPLNTQVSNITPLVAGANDFAIGQPLSGVTSVPGRYNAFETSTPAGSILGKIQTRVSGTAFSVDVVNINAAKTGVAAVAITVEVRLLDSSAGGALDVNGCNAGWPLIQAAPNFAIPASGRGTIPAVTVPNSYRDVRFQIRSPVGGPYTQIGCSTDRLAIRPQSLTVSALDLNWQSAGTTRTLTSPPNPPPGVVGGNVHKAATAVVALPFTLRATPVPATATNYDGTPTSVTGFPGCGAPLAAALCATPGALSYTAGSWSAAGSGVRENATANYTEAGAFNLQLEDQTYANVDSVDGTSLAARTIPVTATVQVGRFVPDHFAMASNNVPQLKTFNNAACAVRSFTYIGQPFAYVTAPQALVTAQNAANATTTNYSNSLWKIATAAGAQTCTTGPDTCALTSGSVTQSYTYTTTPVATPNWDSAQVVLTTPTVVANNNGTGTVTTSTTDTLAFRRSTTTPQNLFTASIVLTDSVTDSSENAVAGNGIITTTTPAAFSPIAFDSGNEFRYGRMRLSNAQGSEQLNLVIPVVTQYWNGSAFATNTADNCTILAANNIQLIAPPAGVSATAGGMFASGVGALTLTKPTIPAKFSVGLCVDLGVDVPLVCTAAAAAGAAYLQGAWTGANYTNDPSATATFGVYKGNNSFIYLRENY